MGLHVGVVEGSSALLNELWFHLFAE